MMGPRVNKSMEVGRETIKCVANRNGRFKVPLNLLTLHLFLVDKMHSKWHLEQFTRGCIVEFFNRT